MTLEYLEPGQSWDLLCKKISCLDKRIDLVVVLDNRGRVIELEARDGGTNKNLTANKREMLFMEFVLQASMNREYDDEFGRVKGLILEREKVSAFSFQICDYVLVVISKPVSRPIAMQHRIRESIFNQAGLEC